MNEDEILQHKVDKDQEKRTKNINKKKIKNRKKINIDLVHNNLVLFQNKNINKSINIKIEFETNKYKNIK